ncbi:phytanoyl-CoA dioxygenase [Acrasis kona]|uniref:Phytanoyl-CoA dioxygenase n=1 Tax=Acrasis kona TaxID=1008807 RepID=A0AAW2YM79_9EUKA
MLTVDEVGFFHENGFLIKENIIPLRIIEDVKMELCKYVDEMAKKLLSQGKIKNSYAHLGFYERVSEIEKEFEHFSVLLHNIAYYEMQQDGTPKSVRKVWSSPELVEAVSQLIGPKVSGHPVWNLRVKTPGQEQAVVPWHQDHSYSSRDSWDFVNITAWIPLIDATVKNGCLQVVRGGHQKKIVAQHTCCVGNTWYTSLSDETIEEELKCNLNNDVVTCEMKQGSVLFFTFHTPHRSLENTSKDIRWSIDLRFHITGEPNGSDGTEESIVLKDANKNSELQIDWDQWGKNRVKPVPDDPFTTTVSGPWMNEWPVETHNRHTLAFIKDDK